jgi:hypothetical protein
MIQQRSSERNGQEITVAERHARILRYWKAIELFSPQKIPRVNPNSKKEPVLRLGERTRPPWDKSDGFRTPDPGHEWRFTAYCGIYKQDHVRRLLEKRFGRDRSNFDQRTDEEACLFAVQISSKGRPLFDTFVLASCSWVAGRLIDPGLANPEWLEGFEVAAQEAALSFAEQFALLDNDDAGRSATSKPKLAVSQTGCILRPPCTLTRSA